MTLPLTPATDADVTDAALAARGDVAAFERLYRRHVARVHSLGRRMLSDGEADDITQDVFIRVWNKLSSFRGDSAFGTWLQRLAINVILAKRETIANRRKWQDDDEDAGERPSTARVTPELTVDFEKAMQRLPRGQREVFVLHDVEGYKHEEIAGLLGISVGTSKSQLHRVRMALRKHLDR